MNFEIVRNELDPTIVKVIGVGGAGGNAIDRMIEVGIHNVEFIAANTDLQDLRKKKAKTSIQMGPKLTKGFGTGAQWEIGENAAIESKDEIVDILRGTKLLFITAGMGGGTGTGASPVIAQLAKELGILTIGVVTKPFSFEGIPRMRSAEEGIKRLINNVDSLIVIKNENLLKIATKQLSLDKSFEMANNILLYSVQGISDLLTKPGLINLDLSDLETIMRNKGKTVMSIGVGKGDNRASDVVENAISSPLLEEDAITGASSIILNITSGKNFALAEVNQIASAILKEGDENANMIFGHTLDADMEEDVRITVVATGFHPVKTAVVSEKSSSQTKYELFAGKKYDKPAFQRMIKDSFSESEMGSDDKIVKEIREDRLHTGNRIDSNAPPFLVNWNDENYDIPAFLRNKN